MSEITTEATTDSDFYVSPADILLHLIVTLLAPLFVTASGGDFAFARMAALETANAYRARNHVDLIDVAQIIACGLTALGSLGLSMGDDLSLSMVLRLRGNAVALNRSAEQNRRALRESRPTVRSQAGPSQAGPSQAGPSRAEPSWAETPNIPDIAQPGDQLDAESGDQLDAESGDQLDAESGDEFDPAVVGAAVAETQKRAVETEARLKAETQIPANPPALAQASIAAALISPHERARQAAWGAGAATVAGEYIASLPYLPPAERKMATVRAAALNSVANELLSGNGAPQVRPAGLASVLRSNGF